MRTRLLIALALLCLAAVPATVGAAAKAGSWRGQATSKDGKFRYGKVTFRVSGTTMRNLKIESVTVSNCGGLGLKTVFVPRVRIRGTRFSAAYKPVKDVDDTIIVRGTIKGRSARGTFSEGPTCVGEGKFTARAR